MTLSDWLDAERGRSLALATHLDRSKAAVSLWRTDGVPMPLMAAVAAFTDGKVSLEELLMHAHQCRETRAIRSEAA